MPHSVPKEAAIIGKNLKTMRKSCGYSQSVVGKHLGVSSQQVQKYESGQNRFPVDKMWLVHKVFGVPFEAFFVGMR